MKPAPKVSVPCWSSPATYALLFPTERDRAVKYTPQVWFNTNSGVLDLLHVCQMSKPGWLKNTHSRLCEEHPEMFWCLFFSLPGKDRLQGKVGLNQRGGAWRG